MSTKTIDSTIAFSDAGRGVVGYLIAFWESITSGIAAHNEYSALTARGVASHVAAEKVFNKHLAKLG